MTTKVRVRVTEDRVGVVEFENGRYNFLDGDLITSIAEACEELAAQRNARSILLCSSGRHFCAGADFSGAEESFFEEAEYGRHPYDAMVRMLSLDLPVVASVQGAAIGGGLGLALVCDFRFASPESRFAAPFARLGMHQGSAISVTLPLVVGQQNAKDLMFTGRRVSGEEAFSLGLVDRIIPASQLSEGAYEYAAAIAANAPITLRSIRRTLRGDLINRAKEAVKHEIAIQALERTTFDHREGVAADLARRLPAFLDR
ncbi:enoyl-CoA hydratase/isomerase family protein [Paenarthrobacter sp. NPDC089316]|uniref:enoyl-CoA hydratase/isomerase family protein n=1 Tax=unclassified Paenarthrobacter TaxID=2634190 RepID=UPI0034407577